MKEILNEKKYAEKIIKNGFLSKKIRFELKILAKYYFFSQNLPKKEIKLILEAFCRKNIDGFNLNIDYKMINDAILHLSSKKCQYLIIEEIWISQELIDYINNLDFDNETKKVLFTLSMWGKINLECGYSQEYASSFKDYKDLKLSSNIDSKKNIYDIFNILYEKGFLKMTWQGVAKMIFLENIPQGQDLYKITDLSKLGLWFDFYNNANNVLKCEQCGTLFQKRISKNSPQKKCNDCSLTDKDGKRQKIKNDKLLNCEVCNKPFFSSSKKKTIKCETCYSENRKEYFKNKYNSKKNTQE